MMKAIKIIFVFSLAVFSFLVSAQTETTNDENDIETLKVLAERLLARFNEVEAQLDYLCPFSKQAEPILDAGRKELRAIKLKTTSDSILVSLKSSTNELEKLIQIYDACGKEWVERLVKACYRMVETYVVSPATTGDAFQSCVCLVDALQKSEIPLVLEDDRVKALSRPDMLRFYSFQITRETPVGEMLFLNRLKTLQSPSRQKIGHPLYRPAYSQAETANQAISSCLLNIVLHDSHQMLRDVKDYEAGGVIDDGFRGNTQYFPAMNRRPLTKGDSRTVPPGGKDSLFAGFVQPLKGALLSSIQRKYGFELDEAIDSTQYDRALKEAEEVDPDIFLRYNVLVCTYDNGQNYPQETAFYYWLPDQAPSREYLASLPSDHVFQEFLLTTKGCPPVRPTRK